MSSRLGLLAIALAVATLTAAGPARAASDLNPDADEILRSMSKFLGAAQAFSVSADISNEVITRDGEKLQWNRSAELDLRRPAGFHTTVQGRFGTAELSYDGKQAVLYSKDANIYAQREIAGSNEALFTAITTDLGLDLPGVDLLLPDPYAVLAPGVTRSGYHGTEYVSGVECHHLSFREDTVDWQLWVKTGDQPLPMKYVITTKWMTGAPQYTVQLHGWNLAPALPANRFTFSPPPGATKRDRLPVDEAGELVPEENKP